MSQPLPCARPFLPCGLDRYLRWRQAWLPGRANTPRWPYLLRVSAGGARPSRDGGLSRSRNAGLKKRLIWARLAALDTLLARKAAMTSSFPFLLVPSPSPSLAGAVWRRLWPRRLPRLYGRPARFRFVRELIVALTAPGTGGNWSWSLHGTARGGRVTAAAWPQGHSDALSDLDWPRIANAPPGALPPLAAPPARGWAGACGNSAAEPLLGELEQRAQAGLAERLRTTRQQESRGGSRPPRWPRSAAATAVQGCLKASLSSCLAAVRATGKNAHGGADAGRGFFRPQAPAARSTYLPTGKSGGTGSKNRASTSRPPLLPENVGGTKLAGLPATTLHRLLESQGKRFGRHPPAPFGLGSEW